MNLSLHQLRIFSKVAEERSYTKAAQKLFMTQPAVSIQLKQLQEQIGITLIEVIGKKVHLTQAGEYLYKATHQIEETLEDVDLFFANLKGSLTGQFSMSVVSTAKYFMPHMLGAFSRLYDGIEIDLRVSNRFEVLNDLFENRHDLYVMSQVPDDDRLEAIPFLDNPLVLAASIDHPLRGYKEIKPNDLEKYPFLLREEGSGTRMMMEALFEEWEIQPKTAMQLGTNEAVKQAVMAGLGLSIISRLSIPLELQTQNIAIIDMEHFPLESHWYLVYQKSKELSPISKTFIDFSQTYAHDVEEMYGKA